MSEEDEDAAAEPVTGALDEVVLVSVGVEVEVSLDVVVVPALADVDVVACPLSPELEAGGGGGGDSPAGRTVYVQSLSWRMDCAPLLSVTGVRVTLQVCVIVPTSLCDGRGALTASAEGWKRGKVRGISEQEDERSKRGCWNVRL